MIMLEKQAKLAYDAYRQSTFNSYGVPTPEWDKLPEPIQEAWGEAIKAVVYEKRTLYIPDLPEKLLEKLVDTVKKTHASRYYIVEYALEKALIHLSQLLQAKALEHEFNGIA